ncbi:MAG TPA: hypothetical protein VLT62_26510 [Candidatus Methylomirabilis sp.]|nr:hypothetical protein [Candidatus Methylomirabilis sp.]
MRKRIRVWAGLAAGVLIALSGTALAQNNVAGCNNKTGAPEKVEGQVTHVDPEHGKLTLRESNGATHDFQASKETLQQYKLGDHIQAKLRPAANCPPSAS